MAGRTSGVILIAVAVLAAGCGGATTSGEASPRQNAPAQAAATAATTSAEFVADAKRVCARMESRVAGLVQPNARPTPEQLMGIIDAWTVTIHELGDLRPPPAEAQRFARMLSHFESAIRAARAVPDADAEMALAPIAAMADKGMKGATIAHGYGLDECSLFPPAPSQAEWERYVLEQAKKQGGLPGPPPTDLLKPKKRP